MRTLLSFLICSIGSSAALAQQLSGIVSGKGGQPVDAATLSLLHSSDSSWVASELSDSTGHFVFSKVPEGAYLLKVSAVGYRESIGPVSMGKEPQQQNVELQPAGQTLGEVTVTSTKPFIEARPGMMVVNVENSAAAAGNSALELLEKSPGVQVDQQGNISLKGRSIQVLIDGKPANMSGEQLAAYLKSMGSEEIASIELMTQPPARYDAAGNGGLINIKTRKGRKNGLNGSIQTALNYGLYPGGNNSAQLTWKKDRLTVFGSHFYNHFDRYNDMQTSRNFRSPDQALISNYLMRNTDHYGGNFHRFRAGIEYALDESNTVSVGFRLPVGYNSSNSDASTRIRDYAQSSESYNLAHADNQTHWHERQCDLLLKHVFADKSELTVDGMYVGNGVQHDQYMVNTLYDAAGQPGVPQVYRNKFLTAITLGTAQSDFTGNLTEKLKLETGLKYSHVTIDNIAHSAQLYGAQLALDSNRSNHFQYEERVSSAYATLSATLNTKWETSAGLRAEHTGNRGYLPRSGASFERSYLSLFPTLFVQYKASDAHNVSFSYSRRIDRPRYDLLNPTRYYSDRYTYSTGNPYLRPQFSNNLELTYSYKGQLTGTLSYGHTSDIISDVFVQDDTNKITYQENRNIAQYQLWGATVNYNASLLKWWSLTLYGDFYYKQYQGQYDTLPIDITGTGYSFNMNNQVKLGKGWSAEVGGWYRGPDMESVFTRSGIMGTVNAGIAKRMLSDTLTVKVNVQDVFNTLEYTSSNRFANFDYDTRSAWDARRCTVSLSYNFGKKIDLMQRKGDNGVQERQN